MKNRFKLSLSLSSRCNKNQRCDNSPPPPSPAHSQLCAQMHTLDPSLPLFCYFFSPFGMKNEEEGPCLGTACSLKQVQQLLFGALSLLQCLGSVTALHDKWLWEGLLFHPLPSGSTLCTLECGFWECFLLCLHYLKINTVLQREGYTKRFFSCFLRVDKRLGLVLGLPVLTVWSSFNLLAKL